MRRARGAALGNYYLRPPRRCHSKVFRVVLVGGLHAVVAEAARPLPPPRFAAATTCSLPQRRAMSRTFHQGASVKSSATSFPSARVRRRARETSTAMVRRAISSGFVWRLTNSNGSHFARCAGKAGRSRQPQSSRTLGCLPCWDPSS